MPCVPVEDHAIELIFISTKDVALNVLGVHLILRQTPSDIMLI